MATNKKKLAPSPNIYSAQSKLKGAGRGVFAARNIGKGEVIERCPVLVTKKEDRNLLRKTDLMNYYFLWKKSSKNKRAAICFGYGSLYNHSYEPNAVYRKLLTENLIEFFSLRNIKKGEEITINYNGYPDSKKPLWIKTIPPYKKET